MAAARIASPISATGSSASSRPSARCRNWPTPTITGVRGSRVIARHATLSRRAARVAGRRRPARRIVRSAAMSRIAIGSDHAGFELKAHLASCSPARATTSTTSAPTRPSRSTTRSFCAAVGRAVRDGRAELGIVLGGSGQGEQLAANKVRGVRAALCNDLYTARMARAHNDANVLSIGARVVGVGLAEEILQHVPVHRVRGRPPRPAGRQLAELETEF